MARPPSAQVTALAAAALLLGLALMTPRARAQGPAPQAAPAPPPAAAAPAAPGDAAMQAEIQANCTACHDLTPLMAQPRTDDEWATVLQRMAGYKAALADLDLKALQAYLVQKYPAPAR